MALFSRIRSSGTAVSFHLRRFSILSQDSSTPLTSYQKSRAALSLLKSEQDPDRILEICRAASLTPASRLDRINFTVAISKLSEGNHFQAIDTFLHELRSRPDLQNERFASHTLILYGQAKMLNNAVTAFDEFYKEGLCRSSKSLNALVLAGILAKDHKEAKRIFVEFPQSEEKFEEVGKVLNLMKEYGVPIGVYTYNTRIQSLCKLKRSNEAKALLEGGDFETALSICEESMKKNWFPTFSIIKSLVNGLASISKVEEAKELIQKVKKKFSKNQDLWDEVEKGLPQ
ncbi:hypothetical protein CCACVL1_15467 [Corchorus capsularis]|uniref:Pentatricopeptide repeat-containing protein n=1 Tax=Corchorus capsularis TaxID=210143 RepID=A0A1R3I2C6_COCAP|nr:hypothetical protein CCACVL1_15467 [Corchorus capsularis]